MLTEVPATRFVTPLREGGSLPGLVEGGDLDLYVLKFRGAGQGRKTLVAEVVAASIAGALGLPVPPLVQLALDPVLALAEPDPEVQGLIRRSAGANLGMRFLSGALGFDPVAFAVDPGLAGRVVWFDALIGNVDRSWRNPNMLVHEGRLWLIDHGACMIWHHNWPGAEASVERQYDASDHALAPYGPDLAAAEAAFAPRITEELVAGAVAQVPGEWLEGEEGFEDVDSVRAAYTRLLVLRARGLAGRVTLPEPRAAAAGRGGLKISAVSVPGGHS